MHRNKSLPVNMLQPFLSIPSDLSLADPATLITLLSVHAQSCPHVLIQTSDYDKWLIKSNSGMYIETTMPPTTTPRTQIRAGSRIVRSPATATSTSSS